MGETQTSHFYDFGTFGRVPEPQNQVFFILGDTRRPKESRKIPGTFKNTFWYKSQLLGNPNFCQLSKRWAPTNPDDLSNKTLKILDMRSISINKHDIEMWWYGPNIFQNIEGFLNLWNSATLNFHRASLNYKAISRHHELKFTTCVHEIGCCQPTGLGATSSSAAVRPTNSGHRFGIYMSLCLSKQSLL